MIIISQRIRIKQIELFSAKSVLEKPIADATHTLTEISFIVARIHTEGGITGEGYLLSFQYSPQAILGALTDQRERLIGEEVFNTTKVFSQLDHDNEYFGMEGINRWAQGIYNIAMWDASCKNTRTTHLESIRGIRYKNPGLWKRWLDQLFATGTDR